jgi:hypothetical protein
MRVQYKGTVQVGDMNGLFPRQVQPPMRITDFLDLIGPGAYGSVAGMHFNQLHACCSTAPVFVPHDQKVNANVTITDRDQHLLGVQYVRWNKLTIVTSGAYATQHVQAPHWGCQTIDVQCLADHMADVPNMRLEASTHSDTDGSEADLNCQGFRFWLTRACHTAVPNDARAYWMLRWKVGDRWYMIRASSSEPLALLESEDDGLTWSEIRGAFRSSASVTETGGNIGPALSDALVMTITLLNGRMTVAVGGDVLPAVVELPVDDPYSALVTRVTLIAAVWTHVGFALHPHKWRASGSFLSIPHQMGFAPDPSAPPYYEVVAASETAIMADGQTWALTWPVGSYLTLQTARMWDGPGPCPECGVQPKHLHLSGCTYGLLRVTAPQYLATLGNLSAGSYGVEEDGTTPIYYSDRTLVVSRIVTCVDAITQPATRAGTTLLLGSGLETPVQEVTENVTFDPATLTVRHSCDLTLRNFEGIGGLASRWGVNGVGNIAVKVALGYQHRGVFPRFTGYCDTYSFLRPRAGVAYLRLSCSDQMQQLETMQVFPPACMDGWNHYSAIAYLAESAGISRDQMAFAAYVPVDPFDPVGAGGDPDPFFLPMGQGNNPWTPVNRGLSVLQLMDYVRKVTGYLLFFDPSGILHYEQWVPANPGAPTRVFEETPAQADDLAEISSLYTTVSTRDVRNQLLTIGIDPWNADAEQIVLQSEDAASISSPVGSQPVNYVGFRSPMLWMDARFANRDFALQANWRMFRWLRQPSYVVQFTTWAQPDLYVMDCIRVIDLKGNYSSLPLYVVGMSTTYSTLGGNITTRSTITARYLDPYALTP